MPSLVASRTKIQFVRAVVRTTISSIPVMRSPSSACPSGRRGVDAEAVDTDGRAASAGTLPRNARREKRVVMEISCGVYLLTDRSSVGATSSEAIVRRPVGPHGRRPGAGRPAGADAGKADRQRLIE